MQKTSYLTTIILAAGKGTRMNSSIPKVLQTLGGRTLINHTLRLTQDLSSDRVLVVIGHCAEQVKESVTAGNAGVSDVEFIIQEPQLGTGHAVIQCLPSLEGQGGNILILSGDVPRLRPQTVDNLLSLLEKDNADLALLTGCLTDPTGYGRIIRDDSGSATAIREQKDLREGEEEINEVNLGIYVFKAPFLINALPQLKDDNAQGEYYLTDLIDAAARNGGGVTTLCLEDSSEALGINTLLELAKMEKNMRVKVLEKLMDSGVRVVDPDTTFIEDTVEIEPDAVIHPMNTIQGKTSIGSGTVVMPGSIISDSAIGKNVTIRPYCVIAGAQIKEKAIIGPFAHLRPEADIGMDARIGNFVEIKKSVIGNNSKVSHLTYVGDSELGIDVNIGAGCVTCNYDGFNKHQTVIEDGVFVGSGTMMVAPVTLGANSLVGAGSTITDDVPPDALALGRGRQINKDGFVSKWRERVSGKSSEKKVKK